MRSNILCSGFLGPVLAAVTIAACVANVEAVGRHEKQRLAKKHVSKRQVDYADISHFPGGSIGDADKCTWEPTIIYDTNMLRWTQYGSWYDNCASSDTAAITDTVISSVSVENSLTMTTTITVGIADEGFSVGASESFAETWSTTDTFGQSHGITVGPQQAGNINIQKKFFLSEGNRKINYGSKQDGHYIWLNEGLEVYSIDSSSSDVYSANVADCGVLSQAPTGTWFYNDADYAAVKAGSSSTYTYSDD